MDKRRTLSRDEAIGLVRRYKQVIAPRFDVEPRVMMFGSYSKGYANPDSDIDVAVIVPTYGDRKLEIFPNLLRQGGIGATKGVREPKYCRENIFLVEDFSCESIRQTPHRRDGSFCVSKYGQVQLNREWRRKVQWYNKSRYAGYGRLIRRKVAFIKV